MSKVLRTILFSLASLLAVGIISIASISSTANASEIVNNAYKKDVMASCSQYDNDVNRSYACVYGALGNAGLKYFPNNTESCNVEEFSTEERQACRNAANAGAKAFGKNFSQFSKDGFIKDVEDACASLSSITSNYQICLESGIGSTDKSFNFPYTPDVCINKFIGMNIEACNQGVAAGNLLLEQYVAVGLQPSVAAAKGQAVGTTTAISSFTPREPLGYDKYGNAIYSDPSKSKTYQNANGSNSHNSGDSGSNGSDDDNGSSNGDSSGNGNSPSGGSNSGNDSSNGSGSGNSSGGGSSSSSGGSSSGGSITVPEYTKPVNLGAGMNGPDSSLANAPVGLSEAFYTNGMGDKMKITIHRPDNSSSRPGIVFVHGGGWIADDKQWEPSFMTQSSPAGPAQNGYISFRVQYTLGSGGLYKTYYDVRNALEYIKNNASKFGLDASRIAMWGDSAGGSLTARVAASGNSGLAAAVTMSGPMNAFRDATWSVPTLAIGIDHITCIDTSFTNGFSALSKYAGLGTTPQTVIDNIMAMSPADQLALGQSVLQDVKTIEENLSNYDWKAELASWGINPEDVSEYTTLVPSASTEMNEIKTVYTNASLTATATSNSNSSAQKLKGEIESIMQSFDDKLIQRSTPVKNVVNSMQSLVSTLSGKGGSLSPSDAENITSQVNSIATELQNLTTELENPSGTGPSEGLLSVVEDMKNNKAVSPSSFRELAGYSAQNSATQLIAASTLPPDQKQALGYASVALDVIAKSGDEDSPFTKVATALVNSPDVGSLVSSLAGVVAGHMQNSQAALLTSKLGRCLDDAIQLSPAIFASPNTPPMFMANAQNETVVPPYDATEMQAKLTSFGTRAEALILSGDQHMGYDERAIDPAFNFLNNILRPAPLGATAGSTLPIP